jgi:negative regulator of sigma E activity
MKPGAQRKTLPVVCDCGDHAFARLKAPFVVLVSAEDAHFLRDMHWAVENRPNGYKKVRRSQRPKGAPRSLAATIMPCPPGKVIDHISCDGLDNRRGNLREATPSQNACNRRWRPRELPKGVVLLPSPKDRPYRASIKLQQKVYVLGFFKTPEEAHQAYVAAAPLYHGEFARLD